MPFVAQFPMSTLLMTFHRFFLYSVVIVSLKYLKRALWFILLPLHYLEIWFKISILMFCRAVIFFIDFSLVSYSHSLVDGIQDSNISESVTMIILWIFHMYLKRMSFLHMLNPEYCISVSARLVLYLLVNFGVLFVSFVALLILLLIYPFSEKLF